MYVRAWVCECEWKRASVWVTWRGFCRPVASPQLGRSGRIAAGAACKCLACLHFALLTSFPFVLWLRHGSLQSKCCLARASGRNSNLEITIKMIHKYVYKGNSVDKGKTEATNYKYNCPTVSRSRKRQKLSENHFKAFQLNGIWLIHYWFVFQLRPATLMKKVIVFLNPKLI